MPEQPLGSLRELLEEAYLEGKLDAQREMREDPYLEQANTQARKYFEKDWTFADWVMTALNLTCTACQIMVPDEQNPDLLALREMGRWSFFSCPSDWKEKFEKVEAFMRELDS